MALLEEMAELQDYQLWVERAQLDAKVGIHMIDGSVGAVDGVPVNTEAEEEVAAR
jgi:hypothetical protein